VVENELCLGSLLHQVELDYRIVARLPIDYPPGLDNPLVRNEFYLSSHNVPAENDKCAAHLAADFGSLGSRGHRLHGSAELHDPGELPGV